MCVLTDSSGHNSIIRATGGNLGFANIFLLALPEDFPAVTGYSMLHVAETAKSELPTTPLTLDKLVLVSHSKIKSEYA